MHIEIAHKFSKHEALEKVKKALEENRPKLENHATIEEERWSGDTLHFRGALQAHKVSGTLEVTDKAFILDAVLPLMFKMFEGRIEKAIKAQITEFL